MINYECFKHLRLFLLLQIAAFGVNIIENSNLDDGTNGWFPLGSCTLSVGSGSPRIIPSMARESLGPHESLSGHYIHVTNRTQIWMGPTQIITEKLKLFLTYQVSAWVRIGSGSNGPQNVNVALNVDNQWVNVGQVEIADGRWHEIGGSFRIEKQASKVMVSIQGPASGVDLMIAGLQIFAVDRQARFKYLRRQTEKVKYMCILYLIRLKHVSNHENMITFCYNSKRMIDFSFHMIKLFRTCFHADP